MDRPGSGSLSGGESCSYTNRLRHPALTASSVGGPTARAVLLPINFAEIDGPKRRITVSALMARQFADAPSWQSADQVTLREEDQITAYLLADTLYAAPARLGPLL